MIDIDIQLRESDTQVYKNIGNGIRDHLNERFPLAIPEIESLVKRNMFQSITSQPEWISIRQGELRVELGLLDGETRLLKILEVWIDSVKINFKKFKNYSRGLLGGIEILAVNSDYSDVLSLAEANFLTEKGEILPWLNWILTAGTNILVADYEIRFGVNVGRTGNGYMILGGGWGISPQFAGTPNDNFITRAINNMWSTVSNEIISIIESKI